MPSFTFLVVEDHLRLRSSLCAWLRHTYAGCECVEAEDGAAALARLDEVAPQAVLLDISLPDMSGLTVAQRMLEHTPQLPIIIITMHDDARYRDDAQRIGAAAFVNKDKLPSALAGALRAILGERPSGATVPG